VPTEETPAAAPSGVRVVRWLLAFVVVIAAGAGGAWYKYYRPLADAKGVAARTTASGEGEHSGKATLGFVDPPAKAGSRTARVEVIAAEVVPHSDILRLTGSLAADERASVASNTSGIAAEVRVDRGSFVRKNDVLVQIDPTDAKNKLAEGQAMLDELKARLGIDENTREFNPEDQPEVRLAKASAELAASNLKRTKDLYAKKVVSTEAFDQAQTEYELATQRYRQALFLIRQAYAVCRTAQIKLAILQKAVADTTIRAPFDGWVAEKLVAVGEQISSGMQATKVVTLVRIDPLRLSLTVPQQDIGRIQPGQTVRFRVDSYPDRVFEAKVRFIAPVVTHDTRSMVVEAMAPNPEAALRPGLFATAELELGKQRPRVFVPVGAVQRLGEVARVFVVRDGVAREQVVALGEVEEGKVEVRSGLTGTEKLAARPELVKDGDPVR
jgi:RND family efflux transporter MFP subunit